MDGPSLAKNLEQVQNKIQRAAATSGRSFNQITLVAVSKKKSAALVKEALALGLRDFGENYVQELTQKMTEVDGAGVRWHYIGSLQKNKIKFVAGKVHLIHSVDRLDLAKEISKHAARAGVVQNILLQIKFGDEPTKGGIPSENALELIGQVSRLPGLRLKGLMSFPPMYADPERARPEFRRLREMLKEGAGLVENKKEFTELSMGTSHDLEVAIEEGATIVRVGTDIFGERT